MLTREQVVGRKDTSNASPEGNLPAAFGKNATHEVLIELWADKGIDSRSLAALMGAHSISRATAQLQHGILPGSESVHSILYAKWLTYVLDL